MKLAQLQSNFFEWVAGADAIPAEVSTVVEGGDTRVGIYAEMYWLRMRDVLRVDFSRVLAAVGEEAFDGLVASYLRVHPSRHYSLGQLGQHFADFLEDPALQSMAALEWARGQAFIAANAEVLEASALAAITEETFARVHLSPTPSLRLIQRDRLVVWRRKFEVFHAEVAAEEALALTSLLAGSGSMPTLCEPFAEPTAAFTAIASWVNEGMIASLKINE